MFLFMTTQDLGEGMDIQDDSTTEAQEASADQAKPAGCEVSRAGASRHIEHTFTMKSFARKITASYVVR